MDIACAAAVGQNLHSRDASRDKRELRIFVVLARFCVYRGDLDVAGVFKRAAVEMRFCLSLHECCVASL